MVNTTSEKVIRTVCRLADWQACGLLAHVKDGELVKLEPADDFPDPGYRHVCARGLASAKVPYHPDRVKYPLKRVGERGAGKWERISWEEALDTIAEKFKEVGEKYGPEAISVGGNISPCVAVAYLRFLSALGGTWLSAIGGYADAAGPGGDMVSYGWSMGGAYNMDFDTPELCVIWGGNPVDTMPMKWRKIRKAKEQGARLIVIDPLFTATAAKADQHISIKPGTDNALVWAIIKYILDRDLYDVSFLVDHTVGPFLVRSDNGRFLREKDIRPEGSDHYMVWDRADDSPKTYDRLAKPALTGEYVVYDIECRTAFQLLKEQSEQYAFEKVSAITGIDVDTIKGLAEQYTDCKPVASFREMGLQRTFHGDLSWRALSVLQAITGNVNLQGRKIFIMNRGGLAKVEGRRPRILPLMEMYDAVIHSKPYPVRALWVSSANLLHQIPNLNKVLREILPRMEFIVDADIVMNTTAQYSDIVLPRCTFFEYTDIIHAGEFGYQPFMQLQQKVIEPMYESRSDFEIITALAERMGLGEHFDMSWEQFLDQMLASGHPSVKGATLEGLKKGPFKMPDHDVSPFKTPSGRIEFYAEKLKEFGEELPVYKTPLETGDEGLSEKYPLVFLTTHSRYRINSTFADNAWLREIEREPALEMNPADGIERGLQDGDMVDVFNDRGRVKVRAKLHHGVSPGVVNLQQGWWPRHFAEGSHQNLSHEAINPVHRVIYEANAAVFDVMVEVKKAASD